MAVSNAVQKIETYLGELGWPHAQLANNVVGTHFDGHFGPVKVMLQLRNPGIRMAISPVLSRPEGNNWGQSVVKLVKALDAESQIIHVGLDQGGDVYVKVDLPTDNIVFEQFAYVLLQLCQVSEHLTVPVLQAQVYDTL